LKINNYALIRNLEIELFPGFSIITGETGAGKSILLDAFSLILGERADTSIILTGSERCVVEACFDIKEYDLEFFFKNNDIDYSDETILRREIYTNGKSRAFINDTPANLSQLKELCINLVDIHSQHQNLQLSNYLFQLKTIDSMAYTKDMLQQYKQLFKKFKEIEKEYQQLIEKSSKAKTDIDYYTFQLKQLDDAKLKEGEQEELETELDILSHSEEIKQNLTNSISLLNNDEYSVLTNLKEIQVLLSKISTYSKPVEDANKRIETVYIELKDILNELEKISEKIEYDPDRIKTISERLDLLYNLQQKHHVSTVAELIKVRDDFFNKINEIEFYDTKIDELNKEKEILNNQLNKLAEDISKKRIETIPKIEGEITELLSQLGMPNAQFKVLHRNLNELTVNGRDEITFMFSANKNIPMQELSKIASGGEISRLMLSLKYIISLNTSLPTLILDEIDTGVSGEIAGKMANIMVKMAEKMQVINITHLPQIASKGKNHYKVYKTEDEKSTITNIKLLKEEERVMEIAKMLSGEQLSDAAIMNAKALLSN
jgi:DNA repair protein RecN (Recombination protein N)